MIYLIPVGGLCNRIRAIDSAISLCDRYGRDLSIIWLNDSSLNCNFHDIFTLTYKGKTQIEIININGYQFLPRQRVIRLPRLGIKVLKTRIEAYISNAFFANVYASSEHLKHKLRMREIDQLFYQKIEPVLSSVLKNMHSPLMLESCYRLCDTDEHSYTYLQPVSDIEEKIKAKVEAFHHTIGLHIRRTDNQRSIQVSTDEKIVRSLEVTLQQEPDSTFFLCSDSEATKQRLIELFGDKIITNEVASYDRNKSGAIKDAVLDLYCLSRTEKIYGSFFSSFSQVAADLGHIEKITIR
ncbi:MAG: hypothetical protein D6730_10530 [Bacteroidetes bacterium]|nr:MAG: hypothetical protein D6730_10530 [Bacteroidota bacterium]